MAADCEDAAMNTPRNGGGDVKLTADVVDGATVAPGDEIGFRLTWDPAQWSGPDLDRALSCVWVKGILEPGMSAEERPAANDGVFEYRLRIPNNIRPDCDVCVEGFLTGMAAGGDRQQFRSERHCFMSGPPRPPTPPVTQPPAPPTPPVTSPPEPETTTTTVPARAPAEEVPAEVGGISASNPSDQGPATPLPAAADPAAELPQTGSAGQAGAAGGGLFLALGGLAVIGGAGRSRRRSPGV